MDTRHTSQVNAAIQAHVQEIAKIVFIWHQDECKHEAQIDGSEYVPVKIESAPDDWTIDCSYYDWNTVSIKRTKVYATAIRERKLYNPS